MIGGLKVGEACWFVYCSKVGVIFCFLGLEWFVGLFIVLGLEWIVYCSWVGVDCLLFVCWSDLFIVLGLK